MANGMLHLRAFDTTKRIGLGRRSCDSRGYRPRIRRFRSPLLAASAARFLVVLGDRFGFRRAGHPGPAQAVGAGVVWALLQPPFLAIFAVFFGWVAKISGDGVPSSSDGLGRAVRTHVEAVPRQHALWLAAPR